MHAYTIIHAHTHTRMYAPHTKITSLKKYTSRFIYIGDSPHDKPSGNVNMDYVERDSK